MKAGARSPTGSAQAVIAASRGSPPNSRCALFFRSRCRPVSSRLSREQHRRRVGHVLGRPNTPRRLSFRRPGSLPIVHDRSPSRSPETARPSSRSSPRRPAGKSTGRRRRRALGPRAMETVGERARNASTRSRRRRNHLLTGWFTLRRDPARASHTVERRRSVPHDRSSRFTPRCRPSTASRRRAGPQDRPSPPRTRPSRSEAPPPRRRRRPTRAPGVRPGTDRPPR